MLPTIEARLTASLKYDVVHGDAAEKLVLCKQIKEAVQELQRRAMRIKELEQRIVELERRPS